MAVRTKNFECVIGALSFLQFNFKKNCLMSYLIFLQFKHYGVYTCSVFFLTPREVVVISIFIKDFFSIFDFIWALGDCCLARSTQTQRHCINFSLKALKKSFFFKLFLLRLVSFIICFFLKKKIYQ